MSERSPDSGVSREDFKRAMGSFATGVTVVCAIDPEGVPWGITVSAFASVSLAPPLCLVCIDHNAASREVLRTARGYAINVLGAGQEELSTNFASRKPDKFAGVAWTRGERTGSPLLAGALVHVECEAVQVFPGGDHDILVGRVVGTRVEAGTPLLYWRGGYADLTGRPPRK